MKTKIDTIIFDLGGVLVDWNPKYIYRKVFNYDEDKVQWFLNTICTSEWNVEQDGGRTIAEAVSLKIAEFPQYEKWIRLFYTEWEGMFSGAIDDNVALFKKLKASGNYNIYALTNWSAETWPKALKLFPFYHDFDGVVVSGQEKTRKPFIEIYKIIINRYNIKPENTVFIDDNIENVATANKIGLNGIHYYNHLQLLDDLRSYEIDL